MEVLEFGRSLLLLGAIVTAGVFVLALVGILRRDRRFVLAARNGLYASCLTVIASAAGSRAAAGRWARGDGRFPDSTGSAFSKLAAHANLFQPPRPRLLRQVCLSKAGIP